MTTRNIFAISLSIGAFLLLVASAAAVPMGQAASENTMIGSVRSDNHPAPVHEVRPGPDGRALPVGRNQIVRLTSASSRMSASGYGSSAGSVQGQAQRTPSVEGQGTASSNPPEPTETVLRLVAWGAGLAAVSLLAFGTYAILRRRVRNYLGRMRNRQLHRQRKRGRGRKHEE